MKISPPSHRSTDTRYKSISLQEFASYWDAAEDEVPPSFGPYLEAVNTMNREADKRDLEAFISCFIQNVSKPTATRTVEENVAIFEKGWAQHQQDWLEKGDLASLVPKYHYTIPPYLMGPDSVMRVAENSFLASNMQALCTRYLALTYLKSFETIHEFGCGSGMNLYLMAEMTPQKKVIGYEWTQSGVAMANSIGKKTGWNVSGRHFDMFHPDRSVDLGGGDAVLIFGVIEQLRDEYHDFIDFLLEKKPGIVINLELDGAEKGQGAMYGQLADFFLRMRGYSTGYTKMLHTLESEKKIAVVFDKILPWLTCFCNLRCTIWRPL